MYVAPQCKVIEMELQQCILESSVEKMEGHGWGK